MNALKAEVVARAKAMQQELDDTVAREARRKPPEPAESEVEGRLRFGKTGTPKHTVGNAVEVLRHDSRWRGRLRLDEFSRIVRLDGQPITDEQVTGITKWVEDVYGVELPGRMFDAVSFVAKENPSHPVREYLESLEWDGVERLDVLLTDYFGVEDAPLHRAFGRKFLIAAVARIMRPACKVDTVLVLGGAQGAMKSSGIQSLASKAWFSDTEFDPGTKDAYDQLQGVWLYELAEFEKWSRRDQSTIKSFITSTEDRYRGAYRRVVDRHPRQVVFVATTNKREFLADPTGSRRFWPVWCGDVDLRGLLHDRDQLWAEAVVAFKAGERWWLDATLEEDLREEAEDYEIEDPWHFRVADWLLGKDDFTVREVLSEALGMLVERQDDRAVKRVAAILRRLGYERQEKARGRDERLPSGGRKRERRWRRCTVGQLP